MSYKEKYRSYIVQAIDEIYDNIINFYNNDYKEFVVRNRCLGTAIPEYTINSDGLCVLESVNGNETIGFENVINLTALETYTDNIFYCKECVVDFCSGRKLTNKKSLMIIDKNSPMTILDINFNLLSSFVNMLELPQKCYDLSGVTAEDNMLDLSQLSYVDFTKFLSGDINFTLLGVKGIKNKCINSTFNTLLLNDIRNLEGLSEPYFTKCRIKSLSISNEMLLNAKSVLFKDCIIDELLISDISFIDRNSAEFKEYAEKMTSLDLYSFNTCTIKKLSLVSNVLLSHTFRSCTIADMEISPTDNNNSGLYLEEMAISYSTFNTRQKLNISRLSESAFYGCVINKDIGKGYKTTYNKPLILSVIQIPDEQSVADAMSAFVDCYGNYEVLDSTAESVSKGTDLFDDNGEVNDDVIYNTLYAILYRGATHYITLPKEFK
jgi:hypothetical protein